MIFLTEQTALAAIVDALASSSSPKLAVAFWGDGAVEKLGLDREGANAKILINLESGACNPREIRKLLGRRPRIEVRTNARLHAKLYWTENKAIIGSSNASSNGLAVEGRELTSWAEANLLVSAPDLLAEMSSWFDNLFQSSLTVEEKDLIQAETIWTKRRADRAPGISSAAGLIETCRRSIDHPVWMKTWVSFTRDEPTREAMETYAALKDEALLADDVDFYQGYQTKLKDGDWVFDFHIASGGKIPFRGVWRILPDIARAKELTFASPSKDFVPDGFGNVRYKDDIKLLSSTVQHFCNNPKTSDDGRSALASVRDVVTYLTEIAKSPST
jgi:HKD family nuclease